MLADDLHVVLKRNCAMGTGMRMRTWTVGWGGHEDRAYGNGTEMGQPCGHGVVIRTGTTGTAGVGFLSPCSSLIYMYTGDTGIYWYMHGYPRKICGYGQGYRCEILYPRQARKALCSKPMTLSLSVGYALMQSSVIYKKKHCFTIPQAGRLLSLASLFLTLEKLGIT